MEGKELQGWCDPVRARAENLQSSSLNTPSGAGPLGSEILNVLTVPVHSATMVQSVSDNDSDRDGEDDDNVSDNDLEIVGEQSGTVGTMDILLDRSRTLTQKYQTCPNLPLIWASFSVTSSMFSPWNHVPMVHQVQLL